MANFDQHVSIAAGVSVAAAATGLCIELLTPQSALFCTLLGIVGGMLPDIDSDHSVPVKLLFGVLAVLLTLLFIASSYHDFSMLGLLSIGWLLYLGIRHTAFHLFARITVHRGTIHSIPAALLASLLVVIAASGLLHLDAPTAWTAGMFMLLGYLTHLSLDELYSVDLANRDIKRSFGTALKLFSRHEPLPFIALYALLAVAVWVAPGMQEGVNAVRQAWHTHPMSGHLLPDEGFLSMLRTPLHPPG